MGKTENRNKPRYNPKQLIEISIEQLKYSYTPYSGFKVGAALLAKNGSVYTGCNIEMQHIHRQTVQKGQHFLRQ